MKRGQEPAYPVPEVEVQNGDGGVFPAELQGMSTRLRIASEQAAGIWAAHEGLHQNNPEQVAAIALAVADALLAAEEETR